LAKLASCALGDAHGLSDVPAELVVDPAADALNAAEGAGEVPGGLLSSPLCCGDFPAKGAGGSALLLPKLGKAAGELLFCPYGSLAAC